MASIMNRGGWEILPVVCFGLQIGWGFPPCSETQRFRVDQIESGQDTKFMCKFILSCKNSIGAWQAVAVLFGLFIFLTFVGCVGVAGYNAIAGDSNEAGEETDAHVPWHLWPDPKESSSKELGRTTN